MKVTRKLDGHSHYTAAVSPGTSQQRRFYAALIEMRNWMGRDRFDHLAATIGHHDRDLDNWNYIITLLSFMAGVEGYSAHAFCYAYLGRDL